MQTNELLLLLTQKYENKKVLFLIKTIRLSVKSSCSIMDFEVTVNLQVHKHPKVVVLQFAAMDLMTTNLIRKQKNSFSFLVMSPTKRI